MRNSCTFTCQMLLFIEKPSSIGFRLKTFAHPVFGAIYLKVSKVAQTSESLSSNFSLGCGGSDGKESACNAEDPGSVPGWENPLEKGMVNPLQHSCLENSMDRGSWPVTVHGLSKESDMTEPLNPCTLYTTEPESDYLHFLSFNLRINELGQCSLCRGVSSHMRNTGK